MAPKKVWVLSCVEKEITTLVDVVLEEERPRSNVIGARPKA
jgi:hypothetical protein